MRPLYKTICLLIACASMCVPPTLDAQTRGRNGGGGGQQPQRTHQQHNNNGGSRPGGKNHNNNNGGRPGGKNHNNNNSGRPGNNGGRPGNNHDNGRRPGGNQGRRPGNGFGNQGHGFHTPHPQRPRPGNHNHGYRPGPVPGYGHIHFGAPHRPMMPPPCPYRRPLPPPRYVPVCRPLFSTILGITIGTALNISLGNLVTNGYTVCGYGNDAIYVNNVNQLGLAWPNATLYYNNGYLDASEFVYSTPYCDMNRYNMAYTMLVNNYGPPVQTQTLSGGGMLTSWWGPGGQYVTLQFAPQYALGGALRYYTTLSIGN